MWDSTVGESNSFCQEGGYRESKELGIEGRIGIWKKLDRREGHSMNKENRAWESLSFMGLESSI